MKVTISIKITGKNVSGTPYIHTISDEEFPNPKSSDERCLVSLITTLRQEQDEALEAAFGFTFDEVYDDMDAEIESLKKIDSIMKELSDPTEEHFSE